MLIIYELFKSIIYHTRLPKEGGTFIFHRIVCYHIELLTMRIDIGVMATEKQFLLVLVEKIKQITRIMANRVYIGIQIIWNKSLKTLLFITEVLQRFHFH